MSSLISFANDVGMVERIIDEAKKELKYRGLNENDLSNIKRLDPDWILKLRKRIHEAFENAMNVEIQGDNFIEIKKRLANKKELLVKLTLIRSSLGFAV